MLDIKFIRQNSELVKKAVKDKNLKVDIDELLAVDEKRRNFIAKSESVKAEQKKTQDREKATVLKSEFKELEKQLDEIEIEFQKLISLVPNVPSDDTPIGPDESGNKVLRQWGKVPKFDFKPKEHWELGEALGVLDTEKASIITGSRFGYLKGELALMEFALIQLVMSIVTDEGTLKKIIKKYDLNVKPKPFIPIVPPVMIKPEVMQRMARLEPRDERYHIPSDDLYLVGSAEHTLGPLHMDETLNEQELPIRYIGFSTAFRREAGSYGKDMKGILRVHQFDKVEMESFTTVGESVEEQNLFVAVQEYFIQQLELPYQVVAVCTGDMGGPDARQIDIETWMPGQNRYRETHTADLMTDFQSRRLNTKYRTGNENKFVHMNDATACAIGRTIIAIMENNQTNEGIIKVPKVLQKYMMGIKEIKLKR